jgi:Bacteriophage head to tail connecting protein
MANDRTYTFADKQQDAEAAFNRATRYWAELQDIYRYFMPFRVSTTQQTGGFRSGKMEGARRTEYLFDGTGPSAAYSFVSNMKADWMPAFQDFFALKNGPLYANPDAADRQTQLDLITRAVHGLTQRVRGTATDEMFADLFAGTGALVLRKGDKRQPIRGFAVPTNEIALENGPWGEVERWYWRRKWPARGVEEMWPDAKFPDGFARALQKNRNLEVQVTQYTYWDMRMKRYVQCVWTDQDSDKELWSEDTATSPWITPRLFVVPGEAMGRGLAHLGLPFVKTVNKARELALRAAAFALLGLWTRRHDGVFNPDTAAMVPGAFWKVASNGSGQLGPSISRLDVPHNFDISTVVINDEREQIRRVLLDDEMPEMADKVRSPTEIAGRMRRYERNRGGATTRLGFELVTPFVQRSVDIMSELGLLKGPLQLDDVLTQAAVSAPAASAQRTDKVDRFVSYLQMMQQLFGPQILALNAKVEEIIPEIARDLGIEEKFLRSKTQTEQLKALIDSAVQNAMKQQQQAERGMPQPPPADAGQQAADQRQQYMNGAY